MIGSTLLTSKELITLLTQVEPCLNFRLLCAISIDPDDLQELILEHFLIGASLDAIPKCDISDIFMSKLKHWELEQQMVRYLWKKMDMDLNTSADM